MQQESLPERALTTPVALFIFNRPEETARTFERIRSAKPKKLFVIADGARNQGEQALCAEARRATERVDWECEEVREYAPHNLGLRERNVSGRNLVFRDHEAAIFLEDDCMPDVSFFGFCEELLHRYAEDARVSCIGGTSCQEKNTSGHFESDYYFSIMSMGWGAFGTWRRVWNLYDANLSNWPAIRDSGMAKRLFDDPVMYHRFAYLWDEYYMQRINNWDGQWSFAQVVSGGLCANPRINLVENIGFNARATHEKIRDPRWLDLPARSMRFPLNHPAEVVRDRKAEQFDFRFFFGRETQRQRLSRILKDRSPRLHKTLKTLAKRSSFQ